MKGVRLLTFDLANSERIFAFVSGSGLYASVNGGANWGPLATESLTNSLPAYDAYKLVVNGNQVWVGFNFSPKARLAEEQRGSLWYSGDHGRAWRQMTGPTLFSGIAYDFYRQGHTTEQRERLYLVAEKGLFSTAMDGEWVWQQHALSGTNLSFRLIAPSNNLEMVYLAAYDHKAATGALYRWQPAGKAPPEQWSQPYAKEPRLLAVDPRPNAAAPVWVMFVNGDIVAVAADGALTAQRGHPGWFWAFKNDLHFFTDAVGQTSLLMGEYDGIRKLKALSE